MNDIKEELNGLSKPRIYSHFLIKKALKKAFQKAIEKHEKKK